MNIDKNNLNIEHVNNMLLEISNIENLEALRVEILGKNGILTNMLKELGSASMEVRQTKGKELNELKHAIAQKFTQKKEEIESIPQPDTHDYSFPFNKSIISENVSKNINLGKRHPIPTTITRLHEIFKASGFQSVNGPDIEDTYYNFEALNIPQEHPARDNNDTFYMHEENKLLRTHTTAVQIRLLEQMKDEPKDIRSYSIGNVYRNDAHDATHACSFHQIEGIIIEDGVTMQHLKGFLEHLFAEFFEKKCHIRFRPSYFPFTEPSCEADIFVKNIEGKLEVTTQDEGKPMELGGCGIIHPSILERFNMNGKQAFAFGFGLERIIMIKHGIANLHDLYNNNIPMLNYITQS